MSAEQRIRFRIAVPAKAIVLADLRKLKAIEDDLANFDGEIAACDDYTRGHDKVLVGWHSPDSAAARSSIAKIMELARGSVS